MKRILLIATGGTIAAKPTDSGLMPLITPEEILESVPGIAELCEVSALSLINVDSTNMSPDHWLLIADCIERHYCECDGFVVAHGTDTMAYTAGALTYLVQRSRKPIVLTGAQKSIFMRDTDARTNLLDAFTYAVDELSHGVTIVFDGKVITGARARKSRTKSWNAFSSVDYPELAVIRDARVLRYIAEPAPDGEPVFYHKLNQKVAVQKLIPGADAGVLDYLRERFDALVIESFGVGGVPCYGSEQFMDAIREWIASGKTVVMTTQVPHEGSDMALYQVGSRVKAELSVIEAYDMTLEATVTKLMWILAQTTDPDEVRRLFYTPVTHDLLLY